MAKYMVLYNSTMSASEQMSSASMEQMKASMSEWMRWRDEASKTAKVDFGMPLQAVGRITPAGTEESQSQVSGYSIVEGDSKETIIALLQTHPHLQRPGASIELLEFLSMPGMDV